MTTPRIQFVLKMSETTHPTSMPVQCRYFSGLSKDDRNTIGVYPMKGKIFNTRGETLKRINDNKEIIEMKQILGLEDWIWDNLF